MLNVAGKGGEFQRGHVYISPTMGHADVHSLPSWVLTPRQLCDLELLAVGGFSPLAGFMNRRDYESVRDSMRLANGTLWPIPVTLAVSEATAREAERAGRLALRDGEGHLLGVLQVEEVWRPDRETEAQAVFGTASREHAGVAQFLAEEGAFYAGGRLEVFRPPEHFDFTDLRHTPATLRAEFARRGWEQIVAFQTRNPMHRAHYELTVRASLPTPQASPPSPLPTGEGGALGRDDFAPTTGILIHPAVGMTREGDVDHYTRVRCYQAILPRYPQGTAMLSLLPLAMRLAGPREAVWHAIIRRNYGCTHFIVGRDHAGPGGSFYQPAAAAELALAHQDELGITIVPMPNLVYLPDEQRYVAEEEVPRGARTVSLSGTELRRRLATGEEIPEWFTFPEVARELGRSQQAPAGPGATVFFTGLPASGKSTIARALVARLRETGERPVTLLDGDELRRSLSADLGFSKEDRDEHVRRVGRLAAEITKNGGIAVMALVAPYDEARKDVRRMVEAEGRFMLVYVATPLEVCEARDPKGHYEKARAGKIPQFTGVSDPYEVPGDQDVTISGQANVKESSYEVLGFLRQRDVGHSA